MRGRCGPPRQGRPARGYDGGKKVPGRKRHIVTDCLGLLLVVAGLLTRLRRPHRDISLVCADGGYTGSLVRWRRNKLALTLEILSAQTTWRGFVVLPRRGVAEGTFAWLMNSHRLAGTTKLSRPPARR